MKSNTSPAIQSTYFILNNQDHSLWPVGPGVTRLSAAADRLLVIREVEATDCEEVFLELVLAG